MDLVAYKKTEIGVSHFWRLGSPKFRHQQIQRLARNSFVTGILPGSSHGRRGKYALSSLSYEGTNHLH
jgi:hypothetical protein